MKRAAPLTPVIAPQQIQPVQAIPAPPGLHPIRTTPAFPGNPGFSNAEKRGWQKHALPLPAALKNYLAAAKPSITICWKNWKNS